MVQPLWETIASTETFILFLFFHWFTLHSEVHYMDKSIGPHLNKSLSILRDIPQSPKIQHNQLLKSERYRNHSNSATKSYRASNLLAH